MESFDTPDITRAQWVALAQAILAVLVAFGAPITDEQSIALMALAAVVAGILIHSDRGIRNGRASVLESQAMTLPDLELDARISNIESFLTDATDPGDDVLRLNADDIGRDE